MRQKSNNNSYTSPIKEGGFYRAEVIAVDGETVSVKIPRIGLHDIYEDVPFVGPTPSPSDTVWVSFIENRHGNPIAFTSTSEVITSADIGDTVQAWSDVLDDLSSLSLTLVIPESSDEFLIIDQSTGELRAVDYDDLPGVGGLFADPSPQLSADLDVNGNSITGAFLSFSSSTDVTLTMHQTGAGFTIYNDSPLALFNLAPNGDTYVGGDITVVGTVDGRDVAADGAILDGIEPGADVTDTANVTAAGALMESDVTNLADVKAFDPADYATAAQGATADSALQDVEDDTSPTLAGNLDVNGNKILASSGNITQKLSDNAGSSKWSLQDSDNTEVAQIDSDGNAQFDGDLDVDGVITSSTETGWTTVGGGLTWTNAPSWGTNEARWKLNGSDLICDFYATGATGGASGTVTITLPNSFQAATGAMARQFAGQICAFDISTTDNAVPGMLLLGGGPGDTTCSIQFASGHWTGSNDPFTFASGDYIYGRIIVPVDV